MYFYLIADYTCCKYSTKCCIILIHKRKTVHSLTVLNLTKLLQDIL